MSKIDGAEFFFFLWEELKLLTKCSRWVSSRHIYCTWLELVVPSSVGEKTSKLTDFGWFLVFWQPHITRPSAKQRKNGIRTLRRQWWSSSEWQPYTPQRQAYQCPLSSASQQYTRLCWRPKGKPPSKGAGLDTAAMVNFRLKKIINHTHKNDKILQADYLFEKKLG